MVLFYAELKEGGGGAAGGGGGGGEEAILQENFAPAALTNGLATNLVAS